MTLSFLLDDCLLISLSVKVSDGLWRSRRQDGDSHLLKKADPEPEMKHLSISFPAYLQHKDPGATFPTPQLPAEASSSV